MKLTHEPCKCSNKGCTARLIQLDGYLLDGIHSLETAVNLGVAVNMHDELVAALQRAFEYIDLIYSCGCYSRSTDCVKCSIRATLAKLETKGENKL